MKSTKPLLPLLALGALAILVVGCGGGAKEVLTLSLTGVEPLTNVYHYEGWAIIDDNANLTIAA